MKTLTQKMRGVLLLLGLVPIICAGLFAEGNTVTVLIIGDSTASVYKQERSPRAGWGQYLQDFFDPAEVAVIDGARSGRSSKSFCDENAWAKLIPALKPGDYVLIQFGHNDEKDDEARHTEPNSSYKEYLAKYIYDTRAIGATPILLTPIPRNQWNGNQIEDTHGAYPVAMRTLAAELNVPLIDMHERTREYFEQLGPDEMDTIFLILKPGESPNYPEGVTDNTHLQDRGAKAIAAIVAKEIKSLNLPISESVRAIEFSSSCE